VPLPIIRLTARTEAKTAGGAKAAEKPYLSDEHARLCSLGAMVLWLGQLSVETRLRLMRSSPVERSTRSSAIGKADAFPLKIPSRQVIHRES
jgi:hypothetical protein